jgi:hypothetical protein
MHYRWVPSRRAVLWLLGTFGMLVMELDDTSVCGATRYGHVDGACGVVPVKCETEVTGGSRLD